MAWQKLAITVRARAGAATFRVPMRPRSAFAYTGFIMLIAPLLSATAATPFPIADQNPLTRGFYHPLPTGGRLQTFDNGSQFLLSVANTTNMNRRGGERLLVDVESTELRWLWARKLNNDWSLRASVPLVHYGGGIFDPVIDGFHRMFGLPAGSRPLRAENQLAIEYSSPTDSIRADQSYTGIGDASFEVGHQLIDRRAFALSAWSGIELPLGSSRNLAGDGALDAGAWLSGAWQPRARWSISGTMGCTWQGAGDLLADERAGSVGFQNVAGRWDANDRLYLQAQLDMHDSYLSSTRMPLLGAATVLTFGGGYRSRSGWRYGFAISEDLKVNASPDVVFQFTVQPPMGPG